MITYTYFKDAVNQDKISSKIKHSNDIKPIKPQFW